jgi:hypothetical protein
MGAEVKRRPSADAFVVCLLAALSVLGMGIGLPHATAATNGSVSWSGPTRLGTFAQPAGVTLTVTTPDTPPAQHYRVQLTYTYVDPPGSPAGIGDGVPRILTFQKVGSSWKQVTGSPQLLQPTSGFAPGTTTTIPLHLQSWASSGMLLFGGERVTATVTADLVPVDSNGQPQGDPVASTARVFRLAPIRLDKSWPSSIRLGQPTTIPFRYINDTDTTFAVPYYYSSAVQMLKVPNGTNCDYADVSPAYLPMFVVAPHTSKSFHVTVTVRPRTHCFGSSTYRPYHPATAQKAELSVFGFANGFDTETGQVYYHVPVTVLPARVSAPSFAHASTLPTLPATGRQLTAQLLTGLTGAIVGLLLLLLGMQRDRV